MAKGRRPGRDRNSTGPGKGSRNAKPPAAKPVVPPTAQPVKPAAVPPVRPPTAQPVKPAAVRPVAPPAAQPVKPAAARPVAAPVAPVAPASGGGGSATRARGGGGRAQEEEIGRAGRMSRGRPVARGRSGLSVPLKTALVTGAVTLGVLAVAVLAGGPKSEDAGLDKTGRTAARTLAGTKAGFWAGTSPVVGSSTSLLSTAKKVFVDLFGEEGSEWWSDREANAKRPFDDEMDADERAELKEAKERWNTAEKKWVSGDAPTPTRSNRKEADRAITWIVQFADAKTQGYRIMGAWIREVQGGKEGPVIASHPAASSIAYDWTRERNGATPGTISTYAVKVFGAPMAPAQGKKYRAYVALWTGGASAAGTGSGVGLAMLMLGPLLVGGLAYALVAGFTKSVKDVAREIDRLGSSGDASRTLRTQSPEASTVARAVERMVSNLEFRSKHGDADLGEIVDKERDVAEEIHGALMSKNPPRLSDYEVETLFKPGFEIGGDHFEYFRIDDDHLGVILLDTNVRGITAALVMASARSYVRSAAPGVLSPAQVLREVNRNLAGDLPPGRHVTALYVIIDTREGKATIASAGHLPLIVYRHASGKVAKVNPEGIALGLDVGPVFDRALQEGDIPIGVGDRIVLYTDGALKIASDEGEEYGEARFYQAVAKEAPKNSQAFVNFVGSGIDQFHLNTPQNDDITISTVKRLR